MKMNPEQLAAVERETNAVVSAGAGSGKTSVLAERYLRLIRENRAGVEQILTLTFTRKAAAEMYERIYSLLLKEKDKSEAVRRELKNFEKAQISTIDSFCTRVVRNDPARFGLPGSFSQDTEEAALLAEKEALNFLLEKGDSPALESFILRFGFRRVWKGLFASLAMEVFSLAEELDFSAMAARQHQTLTEVLQRDLSALEDLAGQCLALGTTGYAAVTKAQGVLSGLEDLRVLAAEGRYEEVAAGLEGVKVGKSGGKSEVLALYNSLAEALQEVLPRLSVVAHTLAEWKDLESLFALCGEFQDRFLKKKREAGILTFRDVSVMALDMLTGNPEVRRFYKETFRYIMIDEFQDNNRLQKDLLYLLAEKRNLCLDRVPRADELEPDKLFFVGDQKQSIYRFRGADVSVIKELAEELVPGGEAALSLSKNYRSEPALIDFFNTLFSQVMAGADERWEAEFAPLSSRPAELSVSSRIHLFYKPYTAGGDEELLHADDAEAFALASSIRDAVMKKSLPVSVDGVERPAEYGDFAVLMRSTSNQIRYEKMFRLLGVPYVTEDVRALFLEAPLNDIYAALECAVYPRDSLALAAFLRSPFVNLSDEGFVRVLLPGNEAFTGEVPPELSEDDRERYCRGAEIVAYLRASADRKSIVSLIYYLWYRRGYRYTVLKRPAWHGYLEYFDYLREYAYLADRRGLSLAAFLDKMRPQLGQYERMEELSLLRSETTGVRLMTIHKSKGLQFPVVILANMGNVGRSGADTERPYYLSKEQGVAFHVAGTGNFFYNAAREEEAARDLAELKRLLYVAATRAKNHLIFSGCHNRNNRSRNDCLLNLFLRGAGIDPGQVALSPLTVEGLSLHIIDDITEETLFASATGKKGRPVQTALRDYRQARVRDYTAERDEWTATELNELYRTMTEKEEAVEYLEGLSCDGILSSRHLEGDFGTFCHALIEHSLVPSRGLEPELPFSLATLPVEEKTLVTREARRLSEAFLSDPLTTSLPKNTKSYPERQLLYCRRRNGKIPLYINAKPDLFLEGEEENLIVDFKTDKELQSGRYDMQLALYALAARGLNGKKTTTLLFYLRAGRAVRTKLQDEEVVQFLQNI